MIKQSFAYSNLSNYGNYMFYYDYKSGKLKYTFKYSRLPRFGSYVFLYSPQDRITIEESIKMQRIVTNIQDNTNDFKLIRDCDIVLNINNPIRHIDCISKTKNIILVKDESSHLHRLRDDYKLPIISESSDLSLSRSNSEFFMFEEEDLQLQKNNEQRTGVIEIDSKLLEKIDVLLNVSVPSMLCHNIDSVKTSILNDNFLMRDVNRILDIEKDITGASLPITVVDKSEEFLMKHESRNIDTINIKKLQSENRRVDTQSRFYLLDKDSRKSHFEQDNQVDTKKVYKNASSELLSANTQKEHKKTNTETHGAKTKKRYKDVKVVSDDMNTQKEYKKTSTETTERTRSTDKSIIVDFEKTLNKKTQKIKLDTELHGEKNYKAIEKSRTEKGKKSSGNAHIKDIDKLKSEQKELQEQVDEKLKLHKRFWFLDNIGQMDIKILPNKDFQYPPKIEIFEDSEQLHTFMYKYNNRYESVDSEYIVKLYKTSLKGFTEVAKHSILDLSANYNKVIEGIEIKTKNATLSDEAYPNEIYFEINIDSVDFDYMIIEQPNGFIGNKFVFVASEKFIAENHPIPLGEDMGLFEIPISIGIMVDFINILMLIWSKFYISYSGCVGTKAIQSMVDRVYEWLVLETSLEEGSIDAYNRCYRWFRWECEKVYNRAKLDPNLHGNKWIEEIIFEMIDYMDMHHFDSMPEWDYIERMDEQRSGIFQDINLDLEIVVEKFKGIRKRVSNKNKRFKDF